MPPSTPVIELRMRQAHLRDLSSICEFYQNNQHQNLPLPSTKDIAETTDEGRVLLIERISPQELLACGAIFRFSPSNSRTYVGELAGMRALGGVNGLTPQTAQMLLIGARLLGHAATEAEPGPGRTNSLITIVKDGNEASRRNIEAAGFVELSDRPDWFKYDELAWHGKIIKDEWTYYYANNDSVLNVARRLEDVGLFAGRIELSRKNRHTGYDEKFIIYSELRDIENSIEDLKRLLAG
jgi:hypothetical protein